MSVVLWARAGPGVGVVVGGGGGRAGAAARQQRRRRQGSDGLAVRRRLARAPRAREGMPRRMSEGRRGCWRGRRRACVDRSAGRALLLQLGLVQPSLVQPACPSSSPWLLLPARPGKPSDGMARGMCWVVPSVRPRCLPARCLMCLPAAAAGLPAWSDDDDEKGEPKRGFAHLRSASSWREGWPGCRGQGCGRGGRASRGEQADALGVA